MGRCIASRAKSKILHISERWIFDTNQGAFIAILEELHINKVQEYEAIYKANIAVAAYPVDPNQRSVSRRKRNDEDDEEDSHR